MKPRVFSSSQRTPYQQATLRDLRRRNRASLEIAREKRLELLSNAVRLRVQHPDAATCGSRVSIRAEVKSIFAGHHLPTGFMAERQVWLAVEVRAPSGQLVFASGDLDRNGDLRDAQSHEVLTGHVPHDPYLFNLQSRFTALTHKGTERPVSVPVNRHLRPLNVLRPATEPALSWGRPSSFRIAKGSLPPLKKMGQTYPVQLTGGEGNYVVCVRLRFRNLPPALLDHIGVPHLKRVLEVVDMDQYHGVIRVARKG